ncbi:MAG: HlyD family secretion protein [Deltaproteobacteria bacterium]|nr:HlyD family secretion protein [Deltaproteobacteria bacterium]
MSDISENPQPWKKKAIVLLLLLIAVPVGGYYGKRAWDYYSTHVSTDNAYVGVSLAQVTSRIPGAVAEVLVKDNWWVKPSQVLVRLDARDAEVRLAEAQAALQKAKDTVGQMFVSVEVAEERIKEANAELVTAQAQLATMQAEFHQAKLDFQRAQQLSAEEVIAARQFDQAKTNYDVAQAYVHTQQRQLEQLKQTTVTRAKEREQARAALGMATKAEQMKHPLVRQAEAAVREAELNLSYCTITASIEGMTSKKAIEIGQRIQPGQPLLAVVPLQKVYVEANYKETQLSDVRVGQPVEIRADIYPDHVYHGRVDSLGAGTGAAFSLLPPENATGNWVKVVQRVPVKVILTEPPPQDKPLRIGLSVEAIIDTTHRDGALLTSLLQLERVKAEAQESREAAAAVSLNVLPAVIPSGFTAVR